jgi:hypothetical protein
MSNNLTHSDNGVVLRQQEIAILGKTKKGDFICMLGTDNDETKVKIERAIAVNHYFNLKGLIVEASDIFAAGDINTIDSESEAIIAGLLKDSPTSMPAHYDPKTRTAYKLNNENHIRYREGTVSAYMQYNASIIGNPKFVICFVISELRYKNSNLYNNRIKPKIRSNEAIVHNNDTKQECQVLDY